MSTSHISKYIASLWLNDDLSDITFIIGDEKLRAHKLILSSQQYFLKLLYGDFAEKNANEINLGDVGLYPFKTVLKYIYYGHLELHEMNLNEIFDVLSLVDMYNISELATIIQSHLKFLLSLNNAIPILERSRLLGIESLTEACLDFMDIHAADILMHDDFVTLSQVS